MPTLATTTPGEEPFSYTHPIVPWGADAAVRVHPRSRFQARARKAPFFA